MAEDIAPGLRKNVEQSYRNSVANDSELARIQKKIDEGTATGKDLDAYAVRSGELLAQALHEHVSGDILPNGRMYYNIANRLLPPVLRQNYEDVADVSDAIQTIMNEQAGIGIKAQRPELNEDRVEGLVNLAAEAEQYEDIRKELEGDVVNFSQSVATDSVKSNAEFQYQSGLSPKVERTAEPSCCPWCQNLEGTYDYADIRGTGNEVWKRHRACRCVVEYVAAGKRQNAHTKQVSTMDREASAERIQRAQEAEKKDREQEQAEREDRINSFMDYPKIERGESKIIEAGGDANDKIVSGKTVDFGDYQVVISDRLDIKPRELHRIEMQYIRPAIEKIAQEKDGLPVIVLADKTELSSAGRYLYDSNSLFVGLRIHEQGEEDVKYNQHLMFHEMFHWKDCQEIAADHLGITEAEMMPIYNEMAKKALDAAGVDAYNVEKYGDYAMMRYSQGIYYEPYVEYRVYNMMGRWWK